jgi:hypothetical protein
MTPSSRLPFFAAVLLSAAHALAPAKDKLWIEDMRLEAAFIPGKARFALSALGLALKFRWEVLKTRPVTLAFASVAVAAVATLLFVPRIFDNAPTNTASMSAPSSYETASEYAQDAAESRGIIADAQMGEPNPENTQPAPDAVAEIPAAPTSPSTAITPTPDSVDTASPPLAAVPAPAEPSATVPATEDAITEQATLGEAGNELDAATTLSRVEDSAEQSPPAPLTPLPETTVVSTPVRTSEVILAATGKTLLTIYSGSDFAGNPRVHRYLETGETLTLGIPFSLYTDNAAAITVTVGDSSFALSDKAEEQFRVFTKP